MDAKTFINKDFRYGDKVLLSMKYPFPDEKDPIECIFGGYKTFGIIETDLDFGLFPVFYREGKNGKILKRSIFGDKHLTWCGLNDIKDVEKVTVPYRHVGYYNNAEDCYNLGIRGPKTVLKAWKNNEGAFINVDNNEVFENVVNDNETTILEDGKYAVRFNYNPSSTKKTNMEGEECGYYIDIFERIDNAIKP